MERPEQPPIGRRGVIASVLLVALLVFDLPYIAHKWSGTWGVTESSIGLRDAVPVVAMGVGFAFRRRFPLSAGLFFAAMTALVPMRLTGFSQLIPFLAANYSAVPYGSWAKGAIVAGASVLASLHTLLPQVEVAGLAPALTIYGFVAMALGHGDVMRRLRYYDLALEATSGSLARQRDEAAEVAAAAERDRIAAELHDIVAHSVSAMLVQAGAARRAAESQPEAAEQALRDLEDRGRCTLVELQQLVKVLRSAEEAVQR